MQQYQAQTIEAHEQFQPYQPNEAFIQVLENLEKEVSSKDAYMRRQLEAIFQQR